MIVAGFQDYVPLSDLWKIVVVAVAVAVVSPAAAALVITGFETQSKAHRLGGSRTPGDLRIVLGVAVLAGLIAVGILALLDA